jgi:hypothetical protein
MLPALVAALAVVGCKPAAPARAPAPVVKWVVVYPGASAEEVDQFVADPLLARMRGVGEVQRARAVSMAGVCEVYFQGRAGTEWDALRAALERADLSAGLSAEATSPRVVRVEGGLPVVRPTTARHVEVHLDRAKLAQLGLPASRVTEAVAEAQEGASPAEFADTGIPLGDGRTVRLGDVAEIKATNKPSCIVRDVPPE